MTRRLLTIALLSVVVTIGSNFALFVAMKAHGMTLVNMDYLAANRVIWTLIGELAK
jgi:hypothetical protein